MVIGLVAGANHSTKEILHPMMQIFKTKNTKLLSTFFIVEHENKDFGNKDYTFLFSDCALNERPRISCFSRNCEGIC
ncbi:MAG: phosphate acyltransferase [Clostridia bacterium]|jgi:phosphate acetyltransferase|nr:phosphate acyltransferase [Clostridiaceae bacterium]